MTRTLSAALALLLCAACSKTPTAPTPMSDLRWDITAIGCAPRLPLPAVSGAPDQRTATAEGVTARWLVFQQGETRRYIIGDFRPVGAATFGICTWNTLDRAVDR